MINRNTGAAFTLGFAALMRVIHLWGYYTGSRTSLYYWPVLACRKFEAAAQALTEGSHIGPFVYASPLYRYILLPFYLAGLDRTGIFILQSLAGILTAWMIYKLALRLGSSALPAILASAVFGLYAPAVFYELTLLPVSILGAIIVFFVMLETETIYKDTYFRSSLLGFLPALMTGLRPPFLLLLSIPIVKWIRKRNWLNLLAGLLVFTIPLVFLAWQHEQAGGGFYPLPRATGLNLVLGHNAESSAYGSSLPSLGLVETGEKDFHEVGIDVARSNGMTTLEECDSYWKNIALEWVLHNPGDEFILLMKKTGAFFGLKPFDQYYELQRVNSFNPIMPFYFVPRGFIIVVFLLGLIPFCVRGKGRGIALFPIAVSLASVLLIFYSERYFLPILPVLLGVSAAGSTILFRMIRKAPLEGIILGLAGLLLLIPAFIYPVPEIPEEQYIGSLGVRAFHMKDYAVALELFERQAVLAPPETVPWLQGHTNAAITCKILGMTERAADHEAMISN